MKKITLRLLVFGLLGLTGTFGVQAQAVEQGNIIIDPYYGFPNFGKAFLKSFDEEADGFKITGIGPAGARVEYMLADRFGMGVDFIYNTFSASWTDTDTTFANNYTYKSTMARTRIQLRFNYHLKASTEDLDLYLGMGAGTNARKWTTETNDPSYGDTETTGTLLPFSLRFAFGMRYYFTENIGVVTEFGLGGPLLSVGASVKF